MVVMWLVWGKKRRQNFGRETRRAETHWMYTVVYHEIASECAKMGACGIHCSWRTFVNVVMNILVP